VSPTETAAIADVVAIGVGGDRFLLHANENNEAGWVEVCKVYNVGGIRGGSFGLGSSEASDLGFVLVVVAVHDGFDDALDFDAGPSDDNDDDEDEEKVGFP
jgi:hypothetical protein